MASGQRGTTLEKLYIELGLDISQLQADILAADKTVTENLGRLNREKNTIKLRVAADIASLDRVKDATKILEIQEKALTQQLALQTDRMKILEAAYKQVASNANSTAVAVNKAEQAFLREKIAVGQLQQQLKELASQKVTPAGGLLGGYNNIKGNVSGKITELAGAFDKLRNATSSADGAVTAVLSVIEKIPSPVGKAVAAFASIPLVLVGIERSVVDMLRATASAGDSVYVMSRGFQMSIADTGKFTSMCKTAGVEVNDLASTIRRTQQQIIRGGDNAKAENWLKRYGESAFDASGHLKNMNEMTLTLSRALKRAQAEGNGMAFILSTMRMASADAITAIEDAEGVYKQAAGLVKNGLLDPAFAHEVQGNLNALNLQTSFMTSTFKSALLPVANEIVPRLTERMAKLTQVIADNKDFIKDFGKTAAEVFGFIEGLVDGIAISIGTVVKGIYDLGTSRKKESAELFLDDKEVDSVEKLMEKDFLRAGREKELKIILANPYLYNQVYAQYEPIFKAIDDARKEIERKNEELAKSAANIPSPANFSQIGQERQAIEQNTEMLDALRKARKIQEEADAILYKLNHTDYENKIFEARRRRTDSLREAELSIEEIKALENRYSAEIIQIEKERADKIAKVQEQIQERYRTATDIQFEITHTAFEKELRDIEQWKDAQLGKVEVAEEVSAIVAEAAAKEARAFEREVDRIAGKVQSLEDKVFEQEHSQYQNDLRKAQQERIKYYQEGIYDPNLIERWYSNEIARLSQRAKKDKNYRKSPEGATERGGNGIMVISGDTITDDGLIQSRQKEIGLLADENQIRAQLLQKQRQELSGDTWAMLAQKVQSIQQPQITLPQQQQPSGIQIIEGDKTIEMPQMATQPLQEFNTALQQTKAVVEEFAMPKELVTPEISTEPLQEFNTSLEKVSLEMESFNPFATIGNAEKFLTERLNQVVQDFPTDYFKNLADGAKSVSEMQMRLTDSTMSLIDAQGKLRNAIANLPNNESQMQMNLPTNEFRQLSASTQDFMNAQQEMLIRRQRELEQMPTPQSQSKGLNFGFDMDTAGTVLGLGALLAGIGGAPITAPIAAGITALSALGGLAKGTYDNSTAPNSTPENLSDLTQIITPLTSIDGNVQNILQDLQNQQETTISFETIVTPLNNIESIAQNILSAIGNAKQPNVTVSPSIKIDLGGAYVFDEKMKSTLTDDITDKIVSAITETVRSETRNRNFAYGA